MDNYTIDALENLLRWINLAHDQLDYLRDIQLSYAGQTICPVPLSSMNSIVIGLEAYANIINFILNNEVME